MNRFILDCDPGHDDAVAILFAARFLALAGLTTTYGNSNLANTTRNALAICELAGLELPVAAGAEAPLGGPMISGAVAHGSSGLDGAALPEPSGAPLPCTAAEFLIEQAERNRGELIIIATGPLTNVATAMAEEARIKEWLGGITLMGGSIGTGNITPAAEFNIYSDPEAAAAVFESGVPLHMVGLNVTHTVGISGADLDRLEGSGGAVAHELAGALRYYLRRQGSLYGRTMAPMHDVCACLPFTHPDLIEYRQARVKVETRGEYTRGMTVCDLRGVIGNDIGPVAAPEPPNARVAVSARGSEIIRVVLDTLLGYP